LNTLYITLVSQCLYYYHHYAVIAGFSESIIWQGATILSGVTRVDVTRGGNLGCHPYFFLKKTGDLFSHHRLCQFCGITPIYFLLKKLTTFFCSSLSSLSLLLISLGCHPLEGVAPHLFYKAMGQIPRSTERISTTWGKKLHRFIFAIALSKRNILRQLFAHIYFNNLAIIRIFHILYIIRGGEPA